MSTGGNRRDRRREMNFTEWAEFITLARDGIKTRMEDLHLSPSQVASLANLAGRTVSRFTRGLTFQPSLRTAVSCSQALDGDLEDWERAMFVDRSRPVKVRSIRSLRKGLKREGYDGIVIDKKEKGIIFNHGRKSFRVRARPESLPFSAWVDIATKVKKAKTETKITVGIGV
jgi:transcriptional regulator with XRE-family HTH domain